MSWRKVVEAFGSKEPWKALPTDRDWERLWDDWL
jgi:hypothetical protein